MNNKIAESVFEWDRVTRKKVVPLRERWNKLSCLEKDTKPLIDIDKEIEKETQGQ